MNDIVDYSVSARSDAWAAESDDKAFFAANLKKTAAMASSTSESFLRLITESR